MTNIHIDTDEIGFIATMAGYDTETHDTEGNRIDLSIDSRHNYFGTVVIDTESAHRIGDLFITMRSIANGTFAEADSFYKTLVELDPEWVKENRVSRESFIR